MARFFRPLRAVGLLAALTACSLPRGAALRSEVLRASDDTATQFSVYPVTRAFLLVEAGWPVTGIKNHGWIAPSRGTAHQIIAPGDRISLTIWDSDSNALLAAPGQKATDLKSVIVSPEGGVFLPYLGRVTVAGLSPEAARAKIQSRIVALVPAAQVQMSVQPGRDNSVDLVSGVAAPHSYPMPTRDLSVLTLIAAAGGVSPTLTNPQIRLIRHGRLYGTSIAQLYANPRRNIMLHGGDKLIVENDRRYFLSLGATGNETLHPFIKDKISALDAMSISGGLSDSRANPRGILVLREYPASALRKNQRGPHQTRVVFTLDLTTADGLFSARNFQINSGDVVLATESPVTTARTILGLIGSAIGISNQASRL